MNRFYIIGNLTKDPTKIEKEHENTIATLSVAINESYKNKEGEKIDKVVFIHVNIYGNLADNAIEYLKKGSQVAIEGKMSSWYKSETKQGGVNFEAQKIQFLSSPKTKPEENVI